VVNAGSGSALNQCLTNLLTIVGRLLVEPAEQEGEAAERAAPSRQEAPRTRKVGSVCCRYQGNFLMLLALVLFSRVFQRKNSRRKYKKRQSRNFFREKRTPLIEICWNNILLYPMIFFHTLSAYRAMYTQDFGG
jgi:hypothetical protein